VGVLKSILSVLLMLLFFGSASGQFTISISSSPSTCSSNGIITITPSGATNPVTYEIISGPPGFSRPSQTVNIFTSIPPGNYQIQATDNNGLVASGSVTVTGTYVPLSITSCTRSGSRITVNAVNGRPPYSYAFSTDGGATFSQPQASNVFDCLPAGSYLFRVLDACNNFFPCQSTVSIIPPTVRFNCTPVSPGVTNIRVTRTDDGEAPFTYTLVNNQGQTLNNSTGIFNNVSGCSYELTVSDRCGRSTSYPNITCVQTDVSLDVSCVNFNARTATITASGGVPPYIYEEARSGAVNATGVFSGLNNVAGVAGYNFIVRDACANTDRFTVYRPGYAPSFIGCPFDSTISLFLPREFGAQGVRCGTPDERCEYHFYPITINCPTCPNQQSVTINRPSRFDAFPVGQSLFTGVPGGNYNISWTDACGNTASSVLRMQLQPISVSVNTNSFCGNRIVRVRRTDGQAYEPGTLISLFDAQNNLIAQNSSGQFSLVRQGTYTARVEAPRCAVTNETFTVAYSLNADIYCDSIGFTPCPGLSNFTYQLIDPGSGNVLQTSTGNSFSNLVSNRNYRIIATSPTLLDTIVFNFSTAQLPPQYVADSITCSSFLIRPEPIDFIWQASGGVAPRYLVFDQGGNQIANQLSPFIDVPASGIYTFRVEHPVCGVRQGTVTIPSNPTPIFCINPSDNFATVPNAATCGFGWNVSYTSGSSQIRVTGGPNNIDIQKDGNGVYQLEGLAPGSYQILTECGAQDLLLPSSPLQVQAQATSTCPGQGEIRASGVLTVQQWASYIASQNTAHCGLGLDISYRLKTFAGAEIATNASGIFNGLQPGNTYKLELVSSNCRLDSLEITIPFYVRPQLASTFGAVCGTPANGDVELNVTGGNPPYRFEIISPGGFPPVVSSNNTVQFNDLPPGTYIYRVSDSCGISSEFSSGVDFFNFTPRFRRLCSGGIQLESPTIIGATYVWRNSAGQVVGNVPSPIVPDNGADVYTVSIQLSSCNYTQSVSVPIQTIPAVFANAGPDIVDTTFTTQLQGIDPNNPNVTNFWFQTSPSSGTTIFSNFSNPQSVISVSQYPGQYTYVWQVDGGENGCTDYDTVTVILVECVDGITDLTANLNVTPSSCTAADGKAKVTVTSPGTVFSYFWSNGGRADSIGGLLPGAYTIQVTDGDFCTRDFFQQFNVVPGITLRTDTIVDLCEGLRFRVGNKFYDQTGTYVDTLVSAFLCDSVITTNLTIRPIERVTVNVSICDGQDFDFNGTLLNAAGTYLDTTFSIFGCDSIVTLNLTVNPVQSTVLDETICSNEVFSFAGADLNTAGVYFDTLSTYLNCDSIVTLNLTVNPVETTNLTETICEGTIFDFNGRSLTTADIYFDTLATYLTCDSVIILDLRVLPLSTAPLNVAICDGQTFTFNSIDYDSSGTYIDTLVNFLGCDSIVTLNLTVNPNQSTIVDAVICSDDVYDFNGVPLNTSGTFTDLLITFLGCDSLVTLNLTVFDVLFTVLDEEICEGERFSFNGVDYDQTGTYIDTLLSTAACDSIVTLNLLVKPISFFSFDVVICERDTFDFNGDLLTTTGVFVDTLLGSNGCDSIITLNLQVNPSPITVLNESICDGEVFDFDGDPITTTGTFTKVLSTYLNCDSTVTLNLLVQPVQTTNLSATICSNETFDFNGVALNTAGFYTDLFATYLGCDSTVNLTLTVNPIATSSISETICQGETYNFNGLDLTAAGVYVDTLRTFQDCDSIITLTLTVNPLSTFDFTEVICDGESFDFNGVLLTTAGSYTQVLSNFLNCDSTITLNLIVNPVQQTMLNEQICNGETFNFIGDVLNATGTYSKTLSTYLNCDSVVILNLTVNDISITNLSETICSNQRYDFNGVQLNQQGVYFDTLTNFLNCDSIVVLDLTVNPIQTRNITATICEGEEYDFNGRLLSNAGVYRDTLRTFQNCDSIIILRLSVNPRTFFSFSNAICDGDVFDFNGQSLSTAGIYIDTIPNFQGCDSVITLDLIVNPVKATFLRDTICDGDTYLFIGQALTAAGDYSRVLRTYLDCDSTVNLNLFVLPRSFTSLSAEICEGTFYDFNGVNYGTAGVYFDTLTNFLGCDSIIDLNLSILPRQRVSIQGEICDNEFYDFNGRSLNQTGTYIDTLPDINTCDSIIMLSLQVNPTYVMVVTDSFCTGDVYIFDAEPISVGGIYDAVLSTIFGCDSTVQLTLLQRNQPTVELGLDTFLCGGFPVIYDLPLEIGTTATWQDGRTDNPYKITTRGNYSVVVDNFCGRDEDDVIVNAGCDGCDVYLPSGFTPNFDGLNDRFFPQFGCDPLAVIDFWVADRWGNIIFRTDQLGEAWDGTYQGKPSPMDNYIWFIRITFELNGELREKTDRGGVLLIR
jgi:gliding motility-associated-like protein